MNQGRIINHRLTNWIHSLALIAAMLGLLAVVGLLLGGMGGLFWASALGALLLLFSRRIPSHFLLRLYGARALSRREAPQAHQLLEEISRRAGLSAAPGLYYIPNGITNALTVGDREGAAIAVGEGLFRRLNRRELAAILAHEISHIRHNDIRVLRFAEVVGRSTQFLSFFGQLLLFFNLPLLLLGRATISWFAILLLIGAPTVSGLLQLALSRTREFDADLGAARLTGDPGGLIQALRKLEFYNTNPLRRLLFPGYEAREPSLFRTHPSTQERARRLQSLLGSRRSETASGAGGDAASPLAVRVSPEAQGRTLRLLP